MISYLAIYAMLGVLVSIASMALDRKQLTRIYAEFRAEDDTPAFFAVTAASVLLMIAIWPVLVPVLFMNGDEG